jgi:ABC-type phosphate transport system substrate-binding protein
MKAILGLVLAAMLSFIGFPIMQAQSEDVAVVVNPDNPATSLSLVELRKIFSGEKRSWLGGVPIRLIMRNSGSHERTVLLKLLHMSEAEYKQYWTAQLLRGEGAADPVVVPSVGMQKEALQTFRGGITLIDWSDVKPGIKILKIDGHMPGEPAYPLH